MAFVPSLLTGKGSYDQAAPLIALSAFGPQDEFLYDKESKFRPSTRQHTNFAQFHRVTKLPGTKFIGQTVTVEMKPKEFGDIFTNIYLALSLPPIVDAAWTDQIGRAIIDKIEFRIGDEIIEKVTDDWLILHDQIFLDAEEKLAMFKSINGGYVEGSDTPGTQQLDLFIPLEFFFCRRHSHADQKPQRLEVPGLPVCALKNTKISFKFFFRPQLWFTNYATPIEFINPRLITEEILLTSEERLYYQTRDFHMVIQRFKNESVQEFSDGRPTLNFSANFPVTTMLWFIRKKEYESLSSIYFGSRYAFGYTSKYLQTAIPLVAFDGAVGRYIDPIDYCDIYLNGRNIMGTFATGPFFTFKQPMEHGLSVPTKSIWTYCFGLSPREYNQGGYLNFEKINADTSKLVIKFNPDYAADINTNYSINLYYYGYAILRFSGGTARLQN